MNRDSITKKINENYINNKNILCNFYGVKAKIVDTVESTDIWLCKNIVLESNDDRIKIVIPIENLSLFRSYGIGDHIYLTAMHLNVFCAESKDKVLAIDKTTNNIILNADARYLVNYTPVGLNNGSGDFLKVPKIKNSELKSIYDDLTIILESKISMDNIYRLHRVESKISNLLKSQYNMDYNVSDKLDKNDLKICKQLLEYIFIILNNKYRENQEK